MSTKKLTVTEIAASLKMDPKYARRKLRDSWPGRRPKQWTFLPSQKKKVVEILKG